MNLALEEEFLLLIMLKFVSTYLILVVKKSYICYVLWSYLLKDMMAD